MVAIKKGKKRRKTSVYLIIIKLCVYYNNYRFYLHGLQESPSTEIWLQFISYFISETRYFERVLNRIIHLKTTKFSFKTTNQAMQKFDSSRYIHTDKLMYVVRTWTCSTFSVTCLGSHSNFFASNSKTTRQSSTVRMNHCCRLHHFTKNHYTEWKTVLNFIYSVRRFQSSDISTKYV